MKIRVGTSGYAFKEWKGQFYPEDLKDADMLSHYASRYPTVEINNTFYRLPKEHVLIDWGSKVPEDFRFTIKASQRITHHARLKAESAGPLDFLLKNIQVMGDKLGAILFQLPPNLKKDVLRLSAFLELLPAGQRVAFEFRHPSWFEDDAVEVLRARGAAMVVIDQDDFQSPMIPTADWGYLRLHRFDYDEKVLAGWAKRIAAEAWQEAYVFFKHDAAVGSGPWAVERFSGFITP